jgi:predicted Zn finger-like uncharacterized protein
MIVQCPRCSTRWRVAEPSATDNPVFKCGRCRHVFPQFPGAPTTGERSTARHRSAASPAADTLEFIFPRRTPVAPADERPAASEASAVPLREIVTDDPHTAELAQSTGPRGGQRRTGLHDAGAQRDAHSATGGDFVLGDESDALPAEVTDGAPARCAGDAPRLADEPAPQTADGRQETSPGREHGALDDTLGSSMADDASDETEGSDDSFDADLERDDEPTPPAPPAAARMLHVEDAMSASAPSPAFGPINRVLLALVGLYALLALLIRVAPERAGDWFARLPLIGATLANQPALGREITLRNVHGGYQRLRNARRVFVISGEALNNSLTAVERIEVEGALYSTAGTVERKIISTGNKTTLKLADLSEPEIAMLQRFDPHRSVAPGESVLFSIVFLEPPRDLREFSSRVVTARPTRRTPTAPSMDRARAPASVG